MSILIKGMEMPKNCGECGLESFCNLWTHTDWEKCRHANCPLIELPPHGDLIDKRMLINDISNNTFANADVDCKEEYDFWNRVWEYIRKVPAVVESEET